MSWLVQIWVAAAIMVAVVGTGNADATVVLHTDDNGRLVGASGVRVDGQTLNVRFFDGSCDTPDSGCFYPWDTPFMAPQAAAHASDALRRHVLIDAPGQFFDSSPELTLGCEDSTACVLVTYESRYGGSYAAVNLSGSARDLVMPTAFEMGGSYDFSLDDRATVALWQDVTIHVPEPSSMALLCLSCLALGLIQHSGRSRKVHPQQAMRSISTPGTRERVSCVN